ncbi:MAG: phosphoadenylyl-sulfate reductase [Acidobacteria bacterium]|nr:phosphoadenylyl-sulfate reductase [Acidobacteriota bacterium]
MTEIDRTELQRLSQEFEHGTPQQVLRWGIEQFRGGITLACSFGAEDVALVDMIARIDPSVPVFYLDTEYLFPETFEVRDRIAARYGIRPVAVRPLLSVEEQAALHGADLFGRQPDLCCKIRKVEPLRRHLGSFQAWIAGIRRDQAPTRANAPLAEWDKIFNLVKLNPLAKWKREDVWAYIRAHDVPYNVLHDRNYPSIGCLPCTRPVLPGEDPRAGRWANFAKKECGLHTENGSTPAS